MAAAIHVVIVGVGVKAEAIAVEPVEDSPMVAAILIGVQRAISRIVIFFLIIPIRSAHHTPLLCTLDGLLPTGFQVFSLARQIPIAYDGHAKPKLVADHPQYNAQDVQHPSFLHQICSAIGTVMPISMCKSLQWFCKICRRRRNISRYCFFWIHNR